MSDYCAIKAEEEALDKMHAALAEHPDGLTARRLADKVGLAIGFVQKLLDYSEQGFFKSGYKWTNDFTESDKYRAEHPWPQWHQDGIDNNRRKYKIVGGKAVRVT